MGTSSRPTQPRVPTSASSAVQPATRSLSFSHQTLLGLTAYSKTRERALIEALLGRRPDGIVLTSACHTKATIKRLSKANIPVVEIWDLTDKPIDMIVGFSHEQVGSEVARHLLGKGCKRFGVVSVDDPRGLRRCESLARELARHGVTPGRRNTLRAGDVTGVARGPQTATGCGFARRGRLQHGYAHARCAGRSRQSAAGRAARPCRHRIRRPIDYRARLSIVVDCSGRRHDDRHENDRSAARALRCRFEVGCPEEQGEHRHGFHDHRSGQCVTHAKRRRPLTGSRPSWEQTYAGAVHASAVSGGSPTAGMESHVA